MKCSSATVFLIITSVVVLFYSCDPSAPNSRHAQTASDEFDESELKPFVKKGKYTISVPDDYHQIKVKIDPNIDEMFISKDGEIGIALMCMDMNAIQFPTEEQELKVFEDSLMTVFVKNMNLILAESIQGRDLTEGDLKEFKGMTAREFSVIARPDQMNFDVKYHYLVVFNEGVLIAVQQHSRLEDYDYNLDKFKKIQSTLIIPKRKLKMDALKPENLPAKSE